MTSDSNYPLISLVSGQTFRLRKVLLFEEEKMNTLLGRLCQSRQRLLDTPRVYEPGISKEKQDAVIDAAIENYDRAINDLKAIIRRRRMRLVP